MMPDHEQRVRCAVGGPLAGAFLGGLRGVTFGEAPLTVIAGMATPEDVVAAVAEHQPEFVLLPTHWLTQRTLGLLDRVSTACASARTLLVGEEPPIMTLFEAMRRGVRGVLGEQAGAEQISRALTAVIGGDLWISRRRLIEMMFVVAPPNADEASGTWSNLPALTEREHAVLGEVLAGKSNKDIARALDISDQTVKIHLQHIYQKLGVRRRMDLLRALT